EEGGVKKHAVYLQQELRNRGDAVDLIGPYSGEAPLPSGTYGFGGVVNISSNGSENRFGIFVRPHQVKRFFQRGRYDVLHVQEPYAPLLPFYAAWFATGAVRVATFHRFSEVESWPSRWARRLCWPHLALFDRAIAVSP